MKPIRFDYIPFVSLSDLFQKIDKFRVFHSEIGQTTRAALDSAGIKYTVMNEYEVVIDSKSIPEGFDMDALMLPASKGIARMSKALGLVPHEYMEMLKDKAKKWDEIAPTELIKS